MIGSSDGSRSSIKLGIGCKRMDMVQICLVFITVYTISWNDYI